MNRTPVTSSTLVSIGYDKDTKTLEVEFKSGIYRCYNVPQEAFDGLRQAKSAGGYFAAQIRGKFDSAKVPASEAKAPA